MALENITENDPTLKELEDKEPETTNTNDDVEEQNTVAPPGICDICAEFYHFLVSGNVIKNILK